MNLAELLEDAIRPDERGSEHADEARALLLRLLAEWGVVELSGGRARAGGSPRRRPRVEGPPPTGPR